MSGLSSFLEGLRQDALNYGVAPSVFIALYLITWPFWYYTLWWIVSGWHRHDRTRIRRGVWSNRLITVTPYAYILLAGGGGMPWTWYAFAIVLPTVTTSIFIYKVNDEVWLEKWWNTYQHTRHRLHLGDGG